MKWRTELTAGSDATLVSQEMSYKLKFGPLGRLMDALVMRRKLDKSVAEILGSLKQCVESSSR
jgi:hypothetical protein